MDPKPTLRRLFSTNSPDVRESEQQPEEVNEANSQTRNNTVIVPHKGLKGCLDRAPGWRHIEDL
jgi:hypothetical protein